MQFPGNWFNADAASFCSPPINDVNAFREELQGQIVRYFQSKTSAEVGSCVLHSTRIHITEARFLRMLAFAQGPTLAAEARHQTTKDAQPSFLTFHGTSGPEAANSILHYGYLLPDDQHPRAGYPLHMRVGNLFGDGVYSSPCHQFAAGYATRSEAGQVQLLVNVVLPGKLVQIDTVCQHVLGLKGKVISRPRPGTVDWYCAMGTGPDKDTKRYPWALNANSLSPDTRLVWVTASPDQTIPVATVIVNAGLTPLFRNMPKRRTAPCETPHSVSIEHRPSILRLTHLCNDLYALPPWVFTKKKASVTPRFRRYFIVSSEQLFNKAFCAALQAHIQTNSVALRGPGADLVVVFGNSSTSAEAVPVGKFDAALPKLRQRCKRVFLESGVGHAFNEIVRCDTARPLYHLVHVFVDTGASVQFDSNGFSRLLEAYAPQMTARYVNVKFGFSTRELHGKPSSLRDAVLRLKEFQAEGVYETLYFTVSPKVAGETNDTAVQKAVDTGAVYNGEAVSASWPEVLGAMEEEAETMWQHSCLSYIGDFDSSRRGVCLEAPHAYAGEGFFLQLDKECVHGGRFTVPVVYKGFPPEEIVVDGRELEVRVIPFVASTTALTEKPIPRKDTLKRSMGIQSKYLGDEREFDESETDRKRAILQRIHEFEAEELKGFSADGTKLTAYVAGQTEILVNMLAAFRNRAVRDPDSVKFFLPAVEKLASGILTVARRRNTDVRVSKKLTLKVASALGELRTLSKLPFGGEWFQRFQAMKFDRKIITRVAKARAGSGVPLGGIHIPSVIIKWPQRGVPIRVRRSAAAAIEPWNIIVEFVGDPETPYYDGSVIGESFRHAELNEDLFDPSGATVTDVLMLDVSLLRSHGFGCVALDGCSSAYQTIPPDPPLTYHTAKAHYEAYICTRNPYLTMRHQGLALRCASFVKVVEHLLRSQAPSTKAKAATGYSFAHEEAVRLAATLAESIAVDVERMADKASKSEEIGAGTAVVSASDSRAFLKVCEAGFSRTAVDTKDGEAVIVSPSTSASARDDGSWAVLPQGVVPDSSEQNDFEKKGDISEYIRRAPAVSAPPSNDGSWAVLRETDLSPVTGRSNTAVENGSIFSKMPFCTPIPSTVESWAVLPTRAVEDSTARIGHSKLGLGFASLPSQRHNEEVVGGLHVSRDDIIKPPALLPVIATVVARHVFARHALIAEGRGVNLDEMQNTLEPRLLFDIMADSVVRLVRGYARSSKAFDPAALMRWLLCVDADGEGMATVRCEDVEKMTCDEVLMRFSDVSRSCRRTAGILLRALDFGCSPHAVVAALGFSDCYAKGMTAGATLEKYTNQTISMKNFLLHCSPPSGRWHAMDTQLALFVFAVDTHGGGLQRPLFSEVVPHRSPGINELPTVLHYVGTVLKKCVADALKARDMRASLFLRLSSKRTARREQLASEIVVACRHHAQFARTFTAADVSELNRNRDMRNLTSLEAVTRDPSLLSGELDIALPYERTPSGLLRQHCAVPGCPRYLRSVATYRDIVSRLAGKPRNHGMRQHLQRVMDGHMVVPGFHLAAVKAMAGAGTADAFLRRMRGAFAKNARYKNTVHEIEEAALRIWQDSCHKTGEVRRETTHPRI
ncbi:hypothetical protein DIPPA_06601 [Diplonema papillatum]|nr:hypothetical protein DIPPA_06601 [Diplonema papillatum]